MNIYESTYRKHHDMYIGIHAACIVVVCWMDYFWRFEMNKQDDWKLAKLEIEFKSYGKDSGKYVGTIRFSNGDFESFNFKIRPEMAEPYIDLIAEDICIAAASLGERLMKSLKLTSSP